MAAKTRENNFTTESMDFISELPQDLLHHILWFLSQKEAVQTCVLAKSWRYVWSTRPKLELDDKDFREDQKKKFMYFLNKTLQRNHDQNLRIDKLVLRTSATKKESIPQLQKWIPIVIRNMGVKEFNLSLKMKKSAYFDLPSAVFQSESLLKLSLSGCNLNSSCSSNSVILLKHLRKLCLDSVDIGDETFEKIMLGCPSIEHVKMRSCVGLRNIKVNKAPNLNYFEFSNNGKDKNQFRSIEIDVPTIESITVSLEWKWLHLHKHFGHLKSLNLERVLLTTDLFRNFSSNNFPCVEELGLKSCTGLNPLKKIELSSVSIKRLVIDDMERFEAAFDTPNIVKFVCEGYIPRSISFTTTTSDKWVSELSLRPPCGYYSKASLWFQKLHQLLGALSQSLISLGIVCDDVFPLIEEDIVYRGSYLPVEVENLRLSFFKFYSYSSFSAFINALFGVCHPRGIYRYWYTSSAQHEENQVTEFLCKILSVDERKDQEADMMMINSWQRDVEEVSFFETFGVRNNKEEWHPVPSSWFEYCAALLPTKNSKDPHHLCFCLVWSS